MDGQVLKERLSKLTNLTQMELAEKLNVSQQSFSQYFLAKDVKSGLLERLAEIIGVDIPTMYGIEPAPTISHNAGDVITGDNIANRVNEESKQMITILDEQLKVKDEQIRVRDEQIGKLINIINK